MRCWIAMPPSSARTRSRFAVRDRLGVIDEPVEPAQRDVPVHALEDREEARDRLVVGGVDAEGPALLREQAHDRLELRLHARAELGPRLEEVLEVRGRPGQVLAGAEHAQEVVAVAGPRHADPAPVVGELLARLLREQVVADAHGHLLLPRELADHRVVVGIVLAAAARVDRARHAEAVQLAHEVARGVGLVLGREHRRAAERASRGSRRSASRRAARSARPFASRSITPRSKRGRVLVVAEHAQRRAVEQRRS